MLPLTLTSAGLINQLIAKSPNARFGLSSNWTARIAQQLAEAKMDALDEAVAAADQAAMTASDENTNPLQTSREALESKPASMETSRVSVTADTIVVLGDQILGKPGSADAARDMLGQLSGREHAVMTGICVEVRFNGTIRRFLATEMTTVTFAALTEEKIAWYIATGEPFDKAGAYGIQGYGSALVKSINGCYYNVMGLPIYRLLDLFEQVERAFPSIHDQIRLLPW